MPDTEKDEMVQAFPPNGADESFDERLRVRRLRSAANRLDSQSWQRRIERVAELAVTATLKVANSQTIGAGSLHEHLSLPRNPSGIGMKRRGRQDDAPRFDGQEGQDEEVAKPLQSQGFNARCRQAHTIVGPPSVAKTESTMQVMHGAGKWASIRGRRSCSRSHRLVRKNISHREAYMTMYFAPDEILSEQVLAM